MQVPGLAGCDTLLAAPPNRQSQETTGRPEGRINSYQPELHKHPNQLHNQFRILDLIGRSLLEKVVSMVSH